MELMFGRFEDLVRGRSGKFSALLISGEGAAVTLEKRLRRMGGEVRRQEHLGEDSPDDHPRVAVIDCDLLGGVTEVATTLARRKSLSRAFAGAILIGSDQPDEDFARTDGDQGPPLVRLCAPASTLSLRMALEYVLGRRLSGW
ncbi:MAG: hypothetical protein Q7J57_08120 [Gemmobacter sp.]|nr:hypothetical protein [Gemmobacter sp.]